VSTRSSRGQLLFNTGAAGRLNSFSLLWPWATAVTGSRKARSWCLASRTVALARPDWLCGEPITCLRPPTTAQPRWAFSRRGGMQPRALEEGSDAPEPFLVSADE